MKKILEQLNIIDINFEKKYSSMIIPSDVDFKINELLVEYQKLSENDKYIFRENITENVYSLLQAFSYRMANLCLNEKEQNLFTNGLYALGIGIERFDFREILMTLTLFYEVTKLTKLSFNDFLESKEPFTATIKEFLTRNDLENILELMGYEILTNERKKLYFHYNSTILRKWRSQGRSN